jgi:hypothetical protein
LKSTQGDVPNWLTPAITGIIAVAFGIFTYRRGRMESPDTAVYSAWADILISSNFSYSQAVRSVSFVVPPILYLGWITVVALFKLALGPAWAKGIVAFNYCLTVLAIGGTLDLIKRITGRSSCVVAAGLLVVIAYDLLNWVGFVLSDASFTALSFAVYYLLCVPSTSTGKTSFLTLKPIVCIALVILALFYRPTGAPVVLIGGLAYLTKGLIKGKGQVERAPLALRIALGLFLLGIATVVVHAYFMKNPSSWPVSFASSWIQRLSDEYHQGYVVFQRPETYVPNPGSLLDYVFITLRKLAYFFSYAADSFSFTHELANLVFFVPAYALSLLAAINLFRKNSHLSMREWWAAWIAVLWICSFALFHGMQQIDFDWRYRLPCTLQLVVLSAIGFKILTFDINARRSKLLKMPHVRVTLSDLSGTRRDIP